MESLSKSTIIEGVASTQARDTQGEILDLNGADITPLLEGKGFVNSDHSSRFEHLIGRVIEAKKIMGLDDCETPSQIKYWAEQKRPFLWSKLELWDGHGHNEADAVSSIYNFYQNNNEEAPIKLSVEGKTIERCRKTGLLKRTVIKGIALTVHPANETTRTNVVSIVKTAGAPNSLIKSSGDIVPLFYEIEDETGAERLLGLASSARDLIKSLAKSESGLKCQSALERLRHLTKS
jgi:hypothetical protein